MSQATDDPSTTNDPGEPARRRGRKADDRNSPRPDEEGLLHVPEETKAQRAKGGLIDTDRTEPATREEANGHDAKKTQATTRDPTTNTDGRASSPLTPLTQDHEKRRGRKRRSRSDGADDGDLDPTNDDETGPHATSDDDTDPHIASDDPERVDRRSRRRMEAEERRRAMALHHCQEAGLDPRRPVVDPTPELPPHEKVVENNELVPERAYARIIYHTKRRSYRYQTVEPPLEPLEEEVAAFLRDTLYRTLDSGPAVDGTEDRRAYLLQAIADAVLDHQVLIDEVGLERVRYHLLRDFLGYGPIDILLKDPLIEDISCDGPGIPVYVFHRQYESIPTNVTFGDDETIDSYVIRLAQMCGKHISLADPLLDATLPDSSRLQATLAREVTSRGSSFTIRRFRSDPLSPVDLVRLGTMSPQMAAFFWMAMEEGDSLILAGGTASGKTTSLNSICQFIPPQRKVVSIEDTREISLRHENWIAGVARPGFSDGGSQRSDAIDMYRLLEAALRQRPEYLLVGEVRGEEAKTLFQAMATGHATYSTMHADSAMSAVYRLENPPISIPRIMLQTLDAIAIQVQVRNGDRLVRRIKEVVEVVGIHPESGDLITNKVFQWDIGEDRHIYRGGSQILRNLMEHRNISVDEVESEWNARARVIEWMAEEGIRHVDEVTPIIADYYRSPEAVLERIDAPKAERENIPLEQTDERSLTSGPGSQNDPTANDGERNERSPVQR